jgi:Ca2+-binding RTX toxin-like protein
MATITGTPFDDVITPTFSSVGDLPTTGNDTINGLEGSDVIDAGGGNDVVDAGAGDDLIYQRQAGYDSVQGGAGLDRLVFDASGETAYYYDHYSPTWRGINNAGLVLYYYNAAGSLVGYGSAVGSE